MVWDIPLLTPCMLSSKSKASIMNDSTTNVSIEEQPVKRPIWQSLAGFVLALIVTVLLLTLSSAIVYPKNNSKEAGMNDAMVYGILAEPEDSIDVIFLGDSEAYSSFSPVQIWGESGFTSYTCGTSAQRICYGNSILRRVTRNQHPRLVVIETNELFRKFSISSALMQTAEDAFPVFEYHDRWKRLVPEDFTFKYQTTTKDPLKGYIAKFGAVAAKNVDYMYSDDEEVEYIPRLNKWYLNGMIDYCRSIGARPILMSTPSTVNWNSKRHNAVQQFADEKGVDYVDMNEGDTKVDIDWETETADGGDHVNNLGAWKVSEFVAGYLSEHYELPDRRGDEAYASWDELVQDWYSDKFD